MAKEGSSGQKALAGATRCARKESKPTVGSPVSTALVRSKGGRYRASTLIATSGGRSIWSEELSEFKTSRGIRFKQRWKWVLCRVCRSSVAGPMTLLTLPPFLISVLVKKIPQFLLGRLTSPRSGGTHFVIMHLTSSAYLSKIGKREMRDAAKKYYVVRHKRSGEMKHAATLLVRYTYKRHKVLFWHDGVFCWHGDINIWRHALAMFEARLLHITCALNMSVDCFMWDKYDRTVAQGRDTPQTVSANCLSLVAKCLLVHKAS